MNPSAVLFDFDGVIVDSFDVHKAAWIEAYVLLFKEPFPQLDAESLTGKSPIVIGEYICEVTNHSGKGRELLKCKTEITMRLEKKPELLPGVRDIISELTVKSIPFAIASNAAECFIRIVLKSYSIEVPVVLGYEHVINPKPAPDLFISAARSLGVPCEQFESIVVFEDSVPGLTAAKSAGMKPIGIRSRFSDSEMREAGAIRIYNNLGEFIF